MSENKLAAQLAEALRDVVRDCEICDWHCEQCRRDYGMLETDLYSTAKNALAAYDAARNEGEKAEAVADSNVEAVVSKLRERSRAGQAKYGVTLERTDLTREQWLQHAQEEALDLANYLQVLLTHPPQPAERSREEAK